MNDTYLSVWNKIPPTRPNNFMAFICKITRNLSVKRLDYNKARKRTPESFASFNELEDVLPDNSIMPGVESEEIGKLISKFLAHEKPHSRAVFMENCIIYGNTLDKESPCDIWNDRTLNIDTVADERSFYEKSTGVKVDVPMDAYQEMVWLFCFTDEEAQLYFSQSAEEIIPPSDDDLENEIDTTVPETPEEPDNAPAPIRPTRPIHIYRPSIEQKQEEKPEKLVLSCGGATLDTSNPLVLLGYSDNQLHENDPITRAQMAILLYRSLTAESKAVLSENTSIFADVESGVWYYDAVSALSSAGIINGCNGLFCPNDNLTWGQLVALLTRFVEPKTAAMPDDVTYSEHWAYENIVTAVAYAWIDDAVTFEPDRIVTRTAAVDFVNSIFESC